MPSALRSVTALRCLRRSWSASRRRFGRWRRVFKGVGGCSSFLLIVSCVGRCSASLDTACAESRGDHSAFRSYIIAFLIIPGCLVVNMGVVVEAGIQTVLRQFESIFDDEGGVGVIRQIILGEAIVLDAVVDQTAEKGNVGAGTNLQKEIGVGSGSRKPRIYADHF